MKHLEKLDILKPSERGKPLVLSKNGLQAVEKLQRIQASRFIPLFTGLNDKEFDQLIVVMGKVDKAATRLVEERLFGKPPVDEEFLS